jgi:pimeloyl-ACP methyl ester carboxylesterase
MTRRIACLAAVLGLCAAALPVAASAAASQQRAEPQITVPAGAVRSAMVCKGNVARARRGAILLIPGTFATAEVNWSWNWQKLLPKLGWAACTITLPEVGAGDIQQNTQYVVSAIRMLAAKSGRPIAVMSHSQGGLEARWALKYWPDTRADIDKVVTLGAPNYGALYPNQNCTAPGSCSASLWQMRSDSKFLAALNKGASTYAIPWTSITTSADTVFVSPSEARMPGAANLLVQSLCPGDQAQHNNLPYDGPTSGIVLDALNHTGPAKLSRVSKSYCNMATMNGVTTAEANQILGAYTATLVHDLGPDGPRAVAEPALACYVTGTCKSRRHRRG